MTTIPFVSRSQFSGTSSPYLRTSGSALQRGGSLRIDSSAQRIRSGTQLSEKDAVEKKLSEEPKSLEELQEQDDRGIRIGGYLGSALRELVRLGDRLTELQNQIDSETNEERKALYNQERESLSAEVERIVTSENFQETLQAAANVQSAVQGGLVSRRALSGATALLGDQYLDLAASGALGAISSINRGFEGLGAFSAASLLENPERAAELADQARGLLDKLQSRTSEEATEREEQGAQKLTVIEPLEFREASFQTAGDIALSLRTYDPKDLLRAVAGGYAGSVDELYQLTIKPPEPKDREEQEKKEEEEERLIEQRDANRNGVRFDTPSDNDESSSSTEESGSSEER